jgi:hypothetical protein
MDFGSRGIESWPLLTIIPDESLDRLSIFSAYVIEVRWVDGGLQHPDPYEARARVGNWNFDQFDTAEVVRHMAYSYSFHGVSLLCSVLTSRPVISHRDAAPRSCVR